MVEAPLRRELVLIVPDLVHDGQHSAAVELLTNLLVEDSQFASPVLEALSSLHLTPEQVKHTDDTHTLSLCWPARPSTLTPRPSALTPIPSLSTDTHPLH